MNDEFWCSTDSFFGGALGWEVIREQAIRQLQNAQEGNAACGACWEGYRLQICWMGWGKEEAAMLKRFKMTEVESKESKSFVLKNKMK